MLLQYPVKTIRRIRRMNDKQKGRTIVNAELLQDFVDGKLDSKTEKKVAAFIDLHPSLISKVEAMSSEDFLNRIRMAHGVELKGGSDKRVSDTDRSEVFSPTHGVSEELEKNASKKSPPAEIPAELASLPDYEIVKELGRGGMGVVYLAKNRRLGDRLEVLKVLNERLSEHSEAKERFLREIAAVAKLKHPSIVTAYSVLPTPNLLVFAMEYVEGTDLAKMIRKLQPFPIDVACSLTQQVAAGLQHAYEKDLVHRDIKPANIIVYRNGKKLAAKILDFGLAKAISEKPSNELTNEGVMLGTLEYVAPEQMLNAARAGIQADIYSLGCTLFHMLVGRPPFVGTIREVMMAHATLEAPMIQIIRPEVPIELAMIVARMLSKEPTSRPMPDELIEALRPFQGKRIQRAPSPLSISETPDVEKARVHSKGDVAPAIQTLVAERLSNEVPKAPTIEAITPNPRYRFRSSRWMIAIATTFIFGSVFTLWMAGFLRIKTPNGTLVFENLPSDAEIQVDGEKVSVTWSDGKESALLTISSGTHEVSVKRGDVEVEGKSVTLKSGEHQKWTVKGETADPKPSESIASDNKEVKESSKPEKTEEERKAEETEAEIEKLRQILLSHEWFYRDSLFPPGGKESFRRNGTFGNWKWNYWVVGPREIRIHYDQKNKNPKTGIPMYFNDDCTRFFGEFKEGNKFHQITGIRK